MRDPAAVLGSAGELAGSSTYPHLPLQNGDGATSRNGTRWESSLKGKGEWPASYSRPTGKQQFVYVHTAISLVLLGPHPNHL